MRRVMLFVLFLLGLTTPVAAQTGIPVYFAPTPIVWSGCQNVNGAINTQVTITIAVPNGFYAYITEFDGQAANNGTGTAAANQKFTSTNLNSTSGSLWSAQYSIPVTANTFASVGPFNFAQTMKSAQAGVNVTFVSPAAAAQTQFNMNACFYLGQ